MAHRTHIAIAAAIGGAVLISVFGYFSYVTSSFDHSKVSVSHASSNQEYLTEEVVGRAVDSTLPEWMTKFFLARFGGPELHAEVRFLTSEEVRLIKDRGGDSQSEYAFLSDSSPVLMVFFDSKSGLAIPEHPMMRAYLEPDSYRVHGTVKDFW